ncbi:MAG: nucleotidyltransferase domain-containing protein [Deltaproteobacteria bacterium]|nr:nucleotidyltransferase domain-containing protein [Deltaproteobacteria bacterium]
MTDTRVEKIKNSLFAIASGIFSKHPVLFAYLYGSYATGVVHPFSDLDIGIYIDKVPDSKHLELELSLSLEIDANIESGVASEVRIINNLPLVILGKTITEGALIYSRDEIIRVDFETSVRSAYFDFLPVIQRYHSTYIDSVC